MYVGLKLIYASTQFAVVVPQEQAANIRRMFRDGKLPAIISLDASSELQRRFGMGTGWDMTTKDLIGIDYFDPFPLQEQNRLKHLEQQVIAKNLETQAQQMGIQQRFVGSGV